PLHPSSVGCRRTKRTKQMAPNNPGPVAENKDPVSTRAVSSPAGASSPASGASSLPQAPIPLKAAKRQYLISSIGGSTAAALGLQSLPQVNLRDTIRRLDIDIVGVVPGLLPATLGALGSTSGGFFVTELERGRAKPPEKTVPPNIPSEKNHRFG